jgi:hypothetical protein
MATTLRRDSTSAIAPGYCLLRTTLTIRGKLFGNRKRWEGIGEGGVMADDKTVRRPRDSSRIAMEEDYEVEYWTAKFGVSREKLQQAVDAVGNGANAVEKHLTG